MFQTLFKVAPIRCSKPYLSLSNQMFQTLFKLAPIIFLKPYLSFHPIKTSSSMGHHWSPPMRCPRGTVQSNHPIYQIRPSIHFTLANMANFFSHSKSSINIPSSIYSIHCSFHPLFIPSIVHSIPCSFHPLFLPSLVPSIPCSFHPLFLPSLVPSIPCSFYPLFFLSLVLSIPCSFYPLFF